MLLTTAALLTSSTRRAAADEPPPSGVAGSKSGSAPGSPESPSPPSRHPRFVRPPIGLDADLFLPSNPATRRQFGSSWFEVGPDIGSIVPADYPGEFEPDFALLGQQYDGPGFRNRAFVAILGVGYATRLGSDGSPLPRGLAPYAGVSIGALYANLSTGSGGHDVDTGIGACASLFAGMAVGRSLYAEIRYRAASTVRGFDLSGTTISTGFRF